MKQKYLEAYMDMAERFAQTSEATRLKVCAMIIKNHSIISIGINGTPTGWHTNVCEDENGNTAFYTRHAESSAFDKLLHSSETSTGATMIITHSPCKMCSIKIKEAGIVAVYYRYEYRCTEGIDYLKKSGILVQQLP